LYISLLRHFWHKVVAVAFDGPPMVGPLPYRFMIRSVKEWCLLSIVFSGRQLQMRSSRQAVVPRGGSQLSGLSLPLRVTFLRLVDRGSPTLQ
jgi:hypothetical protein